MEAQFLADDAKALTEQMKHWWHKLFMQAYHYFLIKNEELGV